MKVTISIDKKFHSKSKEYAKSNGQTLSGLIRVSVEKYLENNDLEKIEDGTTK